MPFICKLRISCAKTFSAAWPEHERIPSVRELAVSLEVNPNTVMRAYAYFQEKGIIYNKRGIGYHVAEDARHGTRNLMRSNFIKNDLPHVFRTMELLDMGLDELETMHKASSEKDS